MEVEDEEAEVVVVVVKVDSLLTVVAVMAMEGEAEVVVDIGQHPLPGLPKLANIPVRNGIMYLIGNSNA